MTTTTSENAEAYADRVACTILETLEGVRPFATKAERELARIVILHAVRAAHSAGKVF